MAYNPGDWARFDNPNFPDFNQIGYRPLQGKGRIPRYTWVKIPNDMWSSDLWCIESGNFVQKGTQWIQIQWGWTYGERAKMASNGTWSARYHIAVPNVAAETGNSVPGANKPASVGQFTHTEGDEVLYGTVNPRTGQPEKFYTRLAPGNICAIPEMEAGATPKVRTFYTVVDNGGPSATRGTTAASAGWKAKMNASGVPEFLQEF